MFLADLWLIRDSVSGKVIGLVESGFAMGLILSLSTWREDSREYSSTLCLYKDQHYKAKFYLPLKPGTKSKAILMTANQPLLLWLNFSW